MHKERDYADEYRRRIERGRKRGWSAKRSRGHLKPGQKALRPRSPVIRTPHLEAAYKLLRLGSTLSQAAGITGVSRSRFRRYLSEQKLASWDKRKRRWRVTDKRVRQLKFASDGRMKTVEVAGFTRSSLVGRFDNAVKRFLDTDNPSELAPFRGRGVEDVRGRFHVFETDPDVLYRLGAADEIHVPEIYALAAA